MAGIPAVVENHLDAIHATADGKVILGSSNLTGRYWNGSLWCFRNADDAPDVEKSVAGVEISAGICDMAYLDKGFVILGLDSGGLEVYQLDAMSDPSVFTKVFEVSEHDDFVSSLSLSCDQKTLVSAGADKCIKIWDTGTWATSATYRPVHSGIVWQVSCSSVDSNVFLTCGQDGKVILFDIRLPKPATLLSSVPMKGEVTAVCWKPGSDCTYAMGDASGSIAVKSTKGLEPVCGWTEYNRRIHKLSFSESQPSWLASIADDSKVLVKDINGENVISVYTDDRHSDFVRDLTWSKGRDSPTFITCGWDKNVISHSVS